MTKSIVFWLVKYPRSIAGTVKYLSTHYNVTCFCLDATIDPSRAKMGWSYDSIGNAKLVNLSTVEDKEQYIKDSLKNIDKDALHFMMGIRNSGINKYVYKYVIGSNKNVAVIAERRTEYALSWHRKLISDIYYYFETLKIRSKVKFVLAMGTLGVKSYCSLGWSKNKVMPFMYHKVTNRDFVQNSAKDEDTTNTGNNVIKFLYVGQFDRRKGIDILISSFNDVIDRNRWELDIVGANGELMNSMLDWAKSRENINYKGVWNSIEVTQNASDYDVCIVPSRYDGWGMFVTEAIEAGVGCITTDKTGSKDLVSSSQAGLVVKSGDVNELCTAIQGCIDNPEIVKAWKIHAKNYRDRISDESIGQYVINCIEYFVDKIGAHPKCPWL